MLLRALRPFFLQAQSIMSTIFGGTSGAATGNARQAPRRRPPPPPPPQQRTELAEEMNSFVIDDDEAYLYFGDEGPRSRRAGRPGAATASGWNSGVLVPPEEQWPELACELSFVPRILPG